MQNQAEQGYEEENLFQIIDEEEKQLANQLDSKNDNHSSHLKNHDQLEPKHLEEFDSQSQRLLDVEIEDETDQRLVDLVADEVHQEVLAVHQKILNEHEDHQPLLEIEAVIEASHKPQSQDMEIEEENHHELARDGNEEQQHNYEGQFGQNEEHRRTSEERVLEPRLLELLLNISNLREIIGTLVVNNEESGNPDPNIRNLSNFNAHISQALTNVEANLLNQNGIQEQLNDIRRLLGLPQEIGAGNNSQGRGGAQQQQPEPAWKRNAKAFARRIMLRVQDYTKSSQFKLDMIFLMSAMLIVINLHLIPENKLKNGVDLIDWLAYSRYSKVLVWVNVSSAL